MGWGKLCTVHVSEVSETGDLNLTYEVYEERPDYWIGERGVILPLWADKLHDKGYRGVCAYDFYDDIFGDDLEVSRMPEDYQQGEYAAIAIERIPTPGRKYRGRRVTVTQGNEELYRLIETSENFCMIAPISYAGKNRTNKNARYLYALCIEIDNIETKNGIDELCYSWKRAVFPMPMPTYIVCSGNGVHLYFVFERPIPLYANIFEQLNEIKKDLTKRFWNSYVTTTHKRGQVQYESLNQPFRCVGSCTKKKTAMQWLLKSARKLR